MARLQYIVAASSLDAYAVLGMAAALYWDADAIYSIAETLPLDVDVMT
jgi:hypothetical protein